VDRGSLAAAVNGGQEGAGKVAAALASFTELQHPIRLEDGQDACRHPEAKADDQCAQDRLEPA
jgi:hypothetical protein